MSNSQGYPLQKGIAAHLPLFVALVVSNFFVGGMVGLERTILPLIAQAEFFISSTAAATAFIATFGITKAGVNFFAGSLSDHWGRKRVLILGWLIALPVPLILMYASHWHWILFANVLLGASQSLTWSMTVVMKIDIAADNQRGLAIGFNEFAGYGGVAVIAFLSGFIASEYDLRPQPFYLGIVLVLCGMMLCLFVKDTRQYALSNQPKITEQKPISLQQVFYRTTWLNPSLSAASLAGLVTNLKDGMLWGLLPFFLSSKGLDLIEIGIVAGIYPVVWSIAQLKFGPLSDRIGRKSLIVNGMAVQGLGIVMFVLTNHYIGFIVAAALAGLGTAMVYPTLLALVADKTEVNWRASALGIYRFWRDLGYAVGALSAGLLADYFGISIAMQVIAVMTFITSYIVFRRVDNSV